jgi:acyl-CoA oxidase
MAACATLTRRAPFLHQPEAMTNDTPRTRLLEDPQLRPFLPLLWVAWSDGDLEPDELRALAAHVDSMPWLRPAARAALSAWLDPQAPPSSSELHTLLETIERVAATLAPDRRRDLATLAASLATDTTEPLTTALEELDARLGGSALWAAKVTEPAQPRGVPTGAPFDIAALRHTLDGDQAVVRTEVRRFLDDPARRAYGLPTAEYRAKVAGWLAELAKHGFGTRAFPGVTSTEPDLGAFIATFETLAMGDLSTLVRFGVQFGLFGGSVYFLGNEEQRRAILPGIADLSTPGCFAMSEVGHGSDVANLETVARWDAETRTFVIHTPREAARKDWIGGAAIHARTATVFAQLEARGERHGVHAFVVPIRHADGSLREGVRAGDSGHKMGLNGVDNGRLWFDHVRVPEDALLGRFAKMAPDGSYTSPIANPNRRFFTMLGTLVGGRVSVASAAVTTAKVALAIAVRYATARRPFGAPEGENALALLAYPTHGRRLLPRVASAYVYHFAVAGLRERFAEAQRPFARTNGTPTDTRELESQAAALKALTTSYAVDTARACREACGGQGYLSVNRLPDLCADVEIFTTFEGDNTILLQLVAKSLLSGFRRRFEGNGVGGVVRHLAEKAKVAVLEKNFVAVRRTNPDHLRDRAFHLAALRFREEHLLDTAAARIRSRLSKGTDGTAALLEVQEHLVALARAYADRLALDLFDGALAHVRDAGQRALLDRLGALHAIEAIRDDAAFFFARGYLEADKERALREESEALIRELQDSAVGLVDAFGIPDACLAAPIAFMDPAHPTW